MPTTAYNYLRKTRSFGCEFFSASTGNYWKLIKIEKMWSLKKWLWESERTKGCQHSISSVLISSIWSNKHSFKINLHPFHTNSMLHDLRFVFSYGYDFLLLKIKKIWSSEKSNIQRNSSILISQAKIVCASYSRKYIKPREKMLMYSNSATW